MSSLVSSNTGVETSPLQSSNHSSAKDGGVGVGSGTSNGSKNMSHDEDPSAAFWELDIVSSSSSSENNMNSSNTLNGWLQKQLSLAVKDLNTIAESNSNNGGTKITPETADRLYHNLLHSVSALKVVEAPAALTAAKEEGEENEDDEDDADKDSDNEENESSSSSDDDDDDEPKRKRKRRRRGRKLKPTKPPPQRILQDPYRIWFQVTDDDDDNNNDDSDTNKIPGIIIWDENQDDIPETAGGKLAVLSIGGLLNAMAAIPAATTTADATIDDQQQRHRRPGLCQTTMPNAKALTKVVAANAYLTQAITALCITVPQIHTLALRLHRAVADQVKQDILKTTPYRIQQMLASDLTDAEFANVRKRVYDTVILGKGMSSGIADDEAAEIPTAAKQAVHDIEKFKKCNTCGNNDQADFVLDPKNGDIICSACGTVVSESLMHEGSQFRKFEGEVDRNHHGDAPNRLYSNAHNMSTSLSGVQPTSGAGIGGWGSGGGSGGGGKRNLETILKNAHAFTELNVSQFGKTERRTRVGYKDRQKKDAFIQMTHTGDALNLHEAVVQRAKELFAGFRDDRELIQQFKAVLAACLCEAFEQLSSEGKNILKQQQAQQAQQLQVKENEDHHDDANHHSHNGGNNHENDDDSKPKLVSARATRRQELHHATMAGKGGLMLNQTDNAEGHAAAKADDMNRNNEKLAAAWDLEDCRTWLLEASRRIAQSWVEERNKDTAAAKKLPTAPKEELEGQLVEHSIKLCEHLEAEWRSRNKTAAVASSTKKRVVTPRVTDMSKLGIKWQGAHERGSGGKGGVGNNARTAVPVGGGDRTAGQILLLKTSKKLGSMLNDPLAGEAFHKELRAVIGRQEERKRQKLREEATRQRFHQMQRKPWIQARVQQED